jgi:hypothetical protein
MLYAELTTHQPVSSVARYCRRTPVLGKMLLICERAALSVNCSIFLSSFSKNVKIDAPENPPTS